MASGQQVLDSALTYHLHPGSTSNTEYLNPAMNTTLMTKPMAEVRGWLIDSLHCCEEVISLFSIHTSSFTATACF